MSALPEQQDAWVRPEWPAPDGIRAMVTTRFGPGVSEPPRERFNLGLGGGANVEHVLVNRQTLEYQLDLPTAPRWLQQVHGKDVVELGPRRSSMPPCADAAVSRSVGTVLAILTADCLPVLLCSDDGAAIGAAHAGWRGLAAGVLESVVATCARPAPHLMAWLGPCVGAKSYEVDASVRDVFLQADEQAEQAFVATRPGHWLCCLETLARQRLRAAGVYRIHGGGFDTVTDPRFYSWRRDGADSGRFASLIWLEPDHRRVEDMQSP